LSSCFIFQINKSITDLNLGHNYFKTEGGKAIAQALEVSTPNLLLPPSLWVCTFVGFSGKHQHHKVGFTV
jgi:hypothetical protein